MIYIILNLPHVRISEQTPIGTALRRHSLIKRTRIMECGPSPLSNNPMIDHNGRVHHINKDGDLAPVGNVRWILADASSRSGCGWLSYRWGGRGDAGDAGTCFVVEVGLAADAWTF